MSTKGFQDFAAQAEITPWIKLKNRCYHIQLQVKVRSVGGF